MPPAPMRLLTHNRGKKETTRKGHDKQSATKKRTQTKTTDTNPNGGWHPMYCSARREKDGERQLRVDSSNGASATAGDRGASSLTFCLVLELRDRRPQTVDNSVFVVCHRVRAGIALSRVGVPPTSTPIFAKCSREVSSKAPLFKVTFDNTSISGMI